VFKVYDYRVLISLVLGAMLPLIKLNSILSLEQHLHKTGFEFDHTVRFTCFVVPIRVPPS
jgi:hypothetical protein